MYQLCLRQSTTNFGTDLQENAVLKLIMYVEITTQRQSITFLESVSNVAVKGSHTHLRAKGDNSTKVRQHIKSRLDYFFLFPIFRLSMGQGV